MSMMEPFIPRPKDEETVAAADPGAGAPAQADGVGTEPVGEEFRRAGRDPLTHEPVEPSREDETAEAAPEE